MVNQSPESWNFNMLVTGIGREEEYRNNLVGTLSQYKIKASGKESIKQLEKLLDQAKERAQHGK